MSEPGRPGIQGRAGAFPLRVSALVALSMLLCRSTPAVGGETGLHHGVVWYTEAPAPIVELGASRYEIGVTGTDFPANKIEIKTRKPGFRWFVYNSVTDNYVPPFATGEHALLEAKASARGWDIEEAYLHYLDDTRLVLKGDTLLIPGWGEGSAEDPAQARVPVYNAELSRRAANFSTPRAARLYKEIILERALGAPFEGSTIYPDGIFLDNSSARLFNHGRILSGGHVRETPDRLPINSADFRRWHWNQNLGPFLASLKDTLEESAAWSLDGQRKYLMINVNGVWEDSYVSLDVADVLFMEFQYNPIRNFGAKAVDEAYRRDRLAADAGITCFYAATMARSHGGHSLTYAEALVGNLAWYLVTRTDNTIFYEFANATPHVAGWDTLTWRGIIDVAGRQLGMTLGDPYTLDEGTDSKGNPYVIKARDYEGGMAVLRNRGQWNQGIEPETAVNVSLPQPMAPVSASGEIGVLVDQVMLRNGQGALFLGDPTR